jgi:hypothetical protein
MICLEIGGGRLRGGGCTQGPVLHVNETKKTDARSARARSAAVPTGHV